MKKRHLKKIKYALVCLGSFSRIYEVEDVKECGDYSTIYKLLLTNQNVLIVPRGSVLFSDNLENFEIIQDPNLFLYKEINITQNHRLLELFEQLVKAMEPIEKIKESPVKKEKTGTKKKNVK